VETRKSGTHASLAL